MRYRAFVSAIARTALYGESAGADRLRAGISSALAARHGSCCPDHEPHFYEHETTGGVLVTGNVTALAGPQYRPAAPDPGPDPGRVQQALDSRDHGPDRGRQVLAAER